MSIEVVAGGSARRSQSKAFNWASLVHTEERPPVELQRQLRKHPGSFGSGGKSTWLMFHGVTQVRVSEVLTPNKPSGSTDDVNF